MSSCDIIPRLWRRPHDVVAQSAWYALGLRASHVGFDHGPLTWVRRLRHELRSIAAGEDRLRLTLLADPGSHQARFAAFWLNRRLKTTHVRVNAGIDQADVFWLMGLDPLSARLKRWAQIVLDARPDRPMINPPDVHDAYHDPMLFPKLAAAGVPVPRTLFTVSDFGRTTVVYKRIGKHAAPMWQSAYAGDCADHRAFEMIDARGPDGLCVRYRAYHVLGHVRPGEAFAAPVWEVRLSTATRIDYAFTLTADEERCIRKIAEVSGLSVFAVDYVRRRLDGAPVFLDVNVHPAMNSWPQRSGDTRHVGQWHAFDTRARLGLPEPPDGPMWPLLETALRRLASMAATRSVEAAQREIGIDRPQHPIQAPTPAVTPTNDSVISVRTLAMMAQADGTKRR